jgi:hypothetical protein
MKLRKDGLNKVEGNVEDALIKAFNTFVKLPIQHPSDREEFTKGIHICQDILGRRVLRRAYPESYFNYENKDRN